MRLLKTLSGFAIFVLGLVLASPADTWVKSHGWHTWIIDLEALLTAKLPEVLTPLIDRLASDFMQGVMFAIALTWAIPMMANLIERIAAKQGWRSSKSAVVSRQPVSMKDVAFASAGGRDLIAGELAVYGTQTPNGLDVTAAIRVTNRSTRQFEVKGVEGRFTLDGIPPDKGAGGGMSSPFKPGEAQWVRFREVRTYRHQPPLVVEAMIHMAFRQDKAGPAQSIKISYRAEVIELPAANGPRAKLAFEAGEPTVEYPDADPWRV